MEDRAVNTAYPFQLWVANLLIAPTLIVVVNLLQQQYILELGMIFLFVIFGFMLSLPALLLTYLVFLWLASKELPAIQVKLLLNVVVIAAVFTTFSVLGGSTSLYFSLVYAASVVLASFLFPVRTRHLNKSTAD